ncbi:uncharacterized protein LOC143849898 [Tasmannia lanceolata]|uniref:uncharacterized protein LOC143849898 n=1 Tax=Tasmannia lanceolata TaxID=3420 RepID=UPI00406396A9
MGSDSTTNFSSVPRDMGKKKRTNRSAKLKQCKLDARREQWLSQVKNKGGKELNGDSSLPPSLPMNDDQSMSLGNLETRSRAEGNAGFIPHDSDTESLMTSPTSSVLGNGLKKERPGTSSSTSSGCFFGSASEEEEEEGGTLDDWEAVADALTADDQHHHVNSESLAVTENTVDSTAPSEFPKSKEKIPMTATMNGRAWRPDDAFRPQSLPNLLKQRSFPIIAERHCGGGPTNWACRGMISQPSSCPICCEDLDFTDSSFLPCLCGFRLCLFCHKRILEADERCPGCRRPYGPVEGDVSVNGGSLPFRFARSCSMSSRS